MSNMQRCLIKDISTVHTLTAEYKIPQVHTNDLTKCWNTGQKYWQKTVFNTVIQNQQLRATPSINN